MKILISAAIIGSALSFQTGSPFASRSKSFSLFETTSADTGSKVEPINEVLLEKTALLDTATELKNEFGCLLIDSKAQETLKKAVEKLESVSEKPVDTAGLLGEWTLLCSTASASVEGSPLGQIAGIDTSKLPFFNEGPLKDIRNGINKSVKVKQIVKAQKSDGIDRVDHVIDYMPPDTPSEFFSNLPDAIKGLNINPLKVSESKVVLVHKAEVESVIPVIKTKLSIESVVLNVAGTSQSLDPAGADVLGINVPFGEFLNSGSFDTTYMDSTLRISRSKTGIVDQLRVFVRATPFPESAFVEMEEDDEVVMDEGLDDEDIIEAPSDV